MLYTLFHLLISLPAIKNNRWKIGSRSILLGEHNYLTEVIFIYSSLCLWLALNRKELQELQNLYKQNSAHTAQQAELIQQLQVLNMDTQKVLKNQEDVHLAESISYQKVCCCSGVKMGNYVHKLRKRNFKFSKFCIISFLLGLTW